MRAIVLVGGEGTRLRPLTFSVPKQMLPVAGLPMIERVLSQLARHGVDEAVLSLGYLPDAFVRAYPDGMAAGVHLSYAVEPEPLDTAGAIGFAAGSAGIDETFVVLNGDVLTDMDLGALVAFHAQRRAEASIALHPVEDPSAFGVVPTDAQGRVEAFVEKPPRGEAPTNLVNAGMYVLEPSVLDRIAPDRRVSIEREVFPAMVADGSLFARPDPAYWIDTGTPAAFMEAQFDLLDATRGTRPPLPGARRGEQGAWTAGEVRCEGSVRGASLLCEGVAVASGATVTRSVVGPRSEVGAGADVRDSVLLEGATVGAAAKVTGSVIGARAALGEGCVVRGASVVGFGAVVPAGAVLDGARFGG